MVFIFKIQNGFLKVEATNCIYSNGNIQSESILPLGEELYFISISDLEARQVSFHKPVSFLFV